MGKCFFLFGFYFSICFLIYEAFLKCFFGVGLALVSWSPEVPSLVERRPGCFLIQSLPDSSNVLWMTQLLWCWEGNDTVWTCIFQNFNSPWTKWIVNHSKYISTLDKFIFEAWKFETQEHSIFNLWTFLSALYYALQCPMIVIIYSLLSSGVEFPGESCPRPLLTLYPSLIHINYMSELVKQLTGGGDSSLNCNVILHTPSIVNKSSFSCISLIWAAFFSSFHVLM